MDAIRREAFLEQHGLNERKIVATGQRILFEYDEVVFSGHKLRVKTCRKWFLGRVMCGGERMYSKVGTEMFRGSPTRPTYVMDTDGNERLDIW